MLNGICEMRGFLSRVNIDLCILNISLIVFNTITSFSP